MCTKDRTILGETVGIAIFIVAMLFIVSLVFWASDWRYNCRPCIRYDKVPSRLHNVNFTKIQDMT